MSDPSYLNKISENQNLIKLASLSVLLMGVSLSFIPVILLPILRKIDKRLAYGYLIFRGALETVTYMVISLCFLGLVYLSQQLSFSRTNHLRCSYSVVC